MDGVDSRSTSRGGRTIATERRCVVNSVTLDRRPVGVFHRVTAPRSFPWRGTGRVLRTGHQCGRSCMKRPTAGVRAGRKSTGGGACWADHEFICGRLAVTRSCWVSCRIRRAHYRRRWSRRAVGPLPSQQNLYVRSLLTPGTVEFAAALRLYYRAFQIAVRTSFGLPCGVEFHRLRLSVHSIKRSLMLGFVCDCWWHSGMGNRGSTTWIVGAIARPMAVRSVTGRGDYTG